MQLCTTRCTNTPLHNVQTLECKQRTNNRVHTAYKQSSAHSVQTIECTQRTNNRVYTAYKQSSVHSVQTIECTQRTNNRVDTAHGYLLESGWVLPYMPRRCLCNAN